MTGLNASLDVAVTSLKAHQQALNTVSHNLANVSNSDYTRQSIYMQASIPQEMGSVYLGRGVDVVAISQSVNQYLENNIMSYNSDLSAADDALPYMTRLESLFAEDTTNGISTLMANYWASWQDLSNNPEDTTLRQSVYSSAESITDQLHSINKGITDVKQDITDHISETVNDINALLSEIAELNSQISNYDGGTTKNDLNDTRNAKLKKLAEKIGFNTISNSKGEINVTICSGLPIVNGATVYRLDVGDDNTLYRLGDDGTKTKLLTVEGGTLGALNNLNKEIVPNIALSLNTFTEEFVWNVNKQHTKGVGLDYFDSQLTGSYEIGTGGRFATLDYGNRIDYTKDFKMWVQDRSSSTTVTKELVMDMDISTAKISNFTTKTDSLDIKNMQFDFTVETSGTVGEIYQVDQISPSFQTGATKAGASSGEVLNSILGEQTISITYGSSSTKVEKVKIPDLYTTPQVKQSAKSVVAALNKVDGITATAGSNSADINLSSLADSSNYGDVVSFKFVIGDVEETVSFTVAESKNSTLVNAKEAFDTALNSMLPKGADVTINYDKLQSDGIVTVTSKTGDNIGIEDFSVKDNIVGSFGGTYENWDLGDTVEVQIQFGSTTQTLEIYMPDTLATGETIQSVAAGLIANKLGIADGEDSVTLTDTNGTLKITKDGNSFDFEATGGINVTFGSISDTLTSNAKLKVFCKNGSTITGTTDLNAVLDASITNSSVAITPTDKAHSITFDGVSVTEDATSDSAFRFSTVAIQLKDTMGMSSNIQGSTSLFSSVKDSSVTIAKKIVVSPATISWRAINTDGSYAGKSGKFTITDSGNMTVNCGNNSTISFDVGYGTLIAGNTFSLQTNDMGKPINLNIYTKGKANVVSSSYNFKIISNGTIGKDDITVEWENGARSGSITLEGNKLDPLKTVLAEFEGMSIFLDAAQVYNGDSFTITTDTSGNPTLEREQDWHWTFQSFQKRFNAVAKAAGVNMQATTVDNKMSFVPTDGSNTYFAFDSGDTYDNGLLATLGINTFFTGENIKDVNVNTTLKEVKYINAGVLYSDGSFGKGDSQNAVKISDLKDAEATIARWSINSDGEMVCNYSEETLDSYYYSFISDFGTKYQTLENSKSFNESMLEGLVTRRDSFSSVSSDEEMIDLIKFQQAWSAASKVIVTVDEMLSTLLNMK